MRAEELIWDGRACAGAARTGNLGWHLAAGRWACRYAAKGGHLEVLKWLRAERCLWDAVECHFAAVHGGHPEVLKWLKWRFAESRCF